MCVDVSTKSNNLILIKKKLNTHYLSIYKYVILKILINKLNHGVKNH